MWVCADYQPGGAPPVGPSAVAIRKGQVFAPKLGKMTDYPTPQALDKAGIKQVVQDAAQGARRALDAGFDGVEMHFANGACSGVSQNARRHICSFQLPLVLLFSLSVQ